MRCKRCGQQIADNSKFCDFCGAKIESKAAKIFCGNCGREIEPGSDFCGFCGTPINEDFSNKIPDELPKKKNSKAGVVVLTVSLVVVAAIASGIVGYFMLSRNINNNQSSNEPSSTMQVIGSTESPVTAASVSPLPTGTTMPNGQMLVSTPTPKPTPVPTPTPVPVMPTAAAASATNNNAKHTYQVVVSKVTWDAANQSAKNKGGYLVAINDSAEFQEVIALLSKGEYAGVKNVWIGACAPDGLNSAADAAAYWNSSQARWVNGDPFVFTKWRSGEPSGYDSTLKVSERYLQMFRPKADNYQWSYNDASNDLSEYKDGTLAYVIEFDH